MSEHHHTDSFDCVRSVFELCRLPAMQPYLSEEVLEQVSSPRAIMLNGQQEWCIRVEAMVAVMKALVAAKQSGRLPMAYWEPARKARLWLEEMDRRGGWEAMVKEGKPDGRFTLDEEDE
jgi:hypothetical protein